MTAQTAGVRIPGKARRILHKRSHAHVATLMPDGSPQVTRAWVDVEDDEIVINMAEARIKVTDVRNDPRVAIAAVDPDNPHEAVIVRGRVTEMSREGADDEVDPLAKRHMGGGEDEETSSEPGGERVTVHVDPEHVSMASA